MSPPKKKSQPKPAPKSTATREYYSGQDRPLEGDAHITALSDSSPERTKSFPASGSKTTAAGKEDDFGVVAVDEAEAREQEKERRASHLIVEEEDLEISQAMMDLDREMRQQGLSNEERVKRLVELREQMAGKKQEERDREMREKGKEYDKEFDEMVGKGKGKKI